MQNLREEIAEMVKLASDKDTAQELSEATGAWANCATASSSS